ncbi:DUF262 domain-containing protein [Micromonospora chersina]|uniref:DUF262 domain-containing protein n=1 Tax=Micromonospora chersina TaxID=47854 RepID=UPI003D935FF9
MTQQRRQTSQPIAWFWDLYRRELLELDPPYQRRSVWNQQYKDYFIDTILLNYPVPAIFLFEDISEDGIGKYAVVDGKQRLTAVVDFLKGEFPVSDSASMNRLQGKYFSDLPPDIKRAVYSYQFSIEFLPSTDESTLNNIFDRINRNVAKLTPQELRHAKYSGVFATSAEKLAEQLQELLPSGFPRIAASSKRQMKDVEFTVQLMLLTENGVGTQSQTDFDTVYAERDEEWENQSRVETEFLVTTTTLAAWSEGLLATEAKRLRNQADFYSLFGATLELLRERRLPDNDTAVSRLASFMFNVADDARRSVDENAKRYYEAARSASNDLAQRRDRITIIRAVLEGEM